MSRQAIEGLKPALLWEKFYEISQIPRPSKKEAKVCEYVKSFAKQNNFTFREDKAGNIVIKVPATTGYEHSSTVVLQGHVDMICEKNNDKRHDFEKDPITLIHDGDWMRADGTTLGADNGIGVAASMAVALDKTIVHGPLELLCTVDEETGLTGVNALEENFISGKYLLNMDSEEDGIFYIGCAGAKDTNGVFKLQKTDLKKGFIPFQLVVTGLKGGHSGLDIHQRRANAIKLLAQLLNRIWGLNFSISSINGGTLRNSIPRDAEATIWLKPSYEEKVKEVIKDFLEDSLMEYRKTDGNLTIKFERKKTGIKKVFTKSFTKKIIDTALALPHGVITMSSDIPGLVETSSNFATITMKGEKINFGTSQRSMIESAKLNISNSISAVYELAGAEVNSTMGYPGWQPNIQSELLKIGKKIYSEKYGSEPEVKAIHAGLETGLLGAKYPGLDMISFGPTIQGAHSPTEKVNINDVSKFYEILKSFLFELTKK